MTKPQTKSCRSLITLFLCAFLLLSSGTDGRQATKPRLRVAADGFPSGHDTPEGAACDVVRSLINRDERLFTSITIRPYGGGSGRATYVEFLRQTVQNIKAEAAKKEPSLQGPKSIGKVFAARHLTKSGPVSYGYAAFGFEDIMFVDVGIYLYNGERSMMRNMVIKDSDGKWYVHPNPSVSPLLSSGLNEEKPSALDITDVYDIEGPKH